MICNNCGKQIRDINTEVCLNCGQIISREFEGNGFYDILSTRDERKKELKHHEEKEKTENVSENLVLELINTYKATNKLLKKQIVFKQITAILTLVFIVISLAFFVSFMGYSAKIDILNENLSKIHIPESIIQVEDDTAKNEVEESTPQEVLYSVVLYDIAEEQLDIFVKGKEIKIDDFVLGEIIENNAGVLTVKAKVIKNDEKILLSDNPHAEIILGQECDFKVDEVTTKGYLKEIYPKEDTN